MLADTMQDTAATTTSYAPAMPSMGCCAPVVPTAGIPPGWHLDEDTGALMRDVIHRMGRRCFRWDYCGTGAYLVTMTLADRSQPLFGRLVGDSAETAAIALSPLGRAIDAHVRRIGEFTPEIEVLAAQLMPEHLHIVLRVKRRMAKPLGIALRLLAFPPVFLGIARLFRLSDEFTLLAVAALAMPVGLNVIVIPSSNGGVPEEASGMVLVSHVLSILTIPFVFWLLTVWK